MARKYKASIDTPDGPRTCFQVTVHHEQGKKPLVARFGGIPLTRKRTAVLTDLKPIMATTKRNELIRRLVAGRCKLCEIGIGLQVHHIRDLRHTGNTLAATTGASTKELMARMGHSSVRAAMIYQHASRSRDKQIADAISHNVRDARRMGHAKGTLGSIAD